MSCLRIWVYLVVVFLVWFVGLLCFGGRNFVKHLQQSFICLLFYLLLVSGTRKRPYISIAKLSPEESCLYFLVITNHFLMILLRLWTILFRAFPVSVKTSILGVSFLITIVLSTGIHCARWQLKAGMWLQQEIYHHPDMSSRPGFLLLPNSTGIGE